MDSADYLIALFDQERSGLSHIGYYIACLLDWRSLVALKRAANLFRAFLSENPTVEAKALARKLRSDWASKPKIKELSLCVEAEGRYPSPPLPVKTVKILEGRQAILAGIGKSVLLFPFCSGGWRSSGQDGSTANNSNRVMTGQVLEGAQLKIPLCSNSLKTKISEAFASSGASNCGAAAEFTNACENLEKNEVTEFDVLGDHLVVGNNNGTLAVWDLDSKQMTVSKQLFGIVTGVKCLEQEQNIVTTHAGKAFDMGVVSVRRMVSPSELTVVWSVYQDIMPIFGFDVNSKWLVTLEWLGTFDLCHVGSATVYNRLEENARTDLADVITPEDLNFDRHHRFTSTAIFNIDYLILASDDGNSLVTWHLPSMTPLRVLQGHKAPVLHLKTSGERILSVDKAGNQLIWNFEGSCDGSLLEMDEKENLLSPQVGCPQVLMGSPPESNVSPVLGVDLDLRRVAFSKVGGITLLDFWSASPLS